MTFKVGTVPALLSAVVPDDVKLVVMLSVPVAVKVPALFAESAFIVPPPVNEAPDATVSAPPVVSALKRLRSAEIRQGRSLSRPMTPLQEMGDSMPEVKNTLIDERDRYLTHRIRNAPGDSIVAVVGAGHVPGMLSYWDQEIEIEELDEIPPKSALAKAWPWVIPAIVIALVIYGFSQSKDQGTMAIGIWVAVNSIPAAIGAIVALAHPLTVLAGAIAAPITSLNPTINAGMVSGLCEAWLRKPKVLDFESLSEDAMHFKGWWHNRVMRILLIVACTNIGSALGTFSAPFLIAWANANFGS